MKSLSNNHLSHTDTFKPQPTKASNWMLQNLHHGLLTLDLSFGLLARELQKRRNSQRHAIVTQILDDVETQLTLLINQEYSAKYLQIDHLSSTPHYSRNVASLNRLDNTYAGSVDRITQSYFHLTRKLGKDMGLSTQIHNIRAAFGMKDVG